MPRIAVVTPYFPTREDPSRGHSAFQTLRQLQRWAEIEVYCPLAAYPRWSWLHPVSFDYHRADLRHSPTDIQACYFEYPAFPLLSRPFNGMVCSRYLLPYLNKARPDLILNYWLYPEGYAAVSVGRKLGVPVIVCAIGSDLRRIPGPITLRLTRKTMREASFVLAVSEELRQRAIGLGVPPERTQAILNGCDTAIFQPGDHAAARVQLSVDTEAELVLYVGRLDPAKGLRELLEAVIQLITSRPRLQLVCAGAGSFQKELEARALRAHVTHAVHFPGLCSSREVARWMAAADILCLPSYSEGCPNVIIEALSCGTPVVATEVGGIPELVDSRCGILVPPRNPQKLAEALHAALTRKWDRTAVSWRLYRGWDQVAYETYQVCSRVLSENPSAAP